MFKGKLRNKIFWMMVLMSISPILIAGFLSVRTIMISHRNNIASLSATLINQKHSEIKRFIDGTIVDNLSIIVSFEQTTDIIPEHQIFILSGILSGIEPIEWVSYININGKETVKLSRLYPGGVLEEDLRDWTGTEGFMEAANGNIYLSPVHPTLKGPMITVVTPTKNKDGKIIAFTAAEASIKSVSEIMGNAPLGGTGYLYLVDRDGALIVGGKSFREMAAGINLKGVGIVADVADGKNFLGPEGQRRYENFFGQRVVAAGKFLEEYGWGLIAEWPVAEADASINELLYNNGTVSLAVVAGVIVASIVLSALIVRPIRLLERGTEKVAEGKFEEEIKIKTGDELEELGSAFNKMMSGLKRLEELKDEFVFIAAHELRTPVAAMKGYLSLILDGTTGAVGEKTKEFVQKVIKSNDRLVQLVNDLLEVSRSEGGRLTIKVAAIDLTEPIKLVLVELEKMAEEKGVKIVYELLDKPQNVLADPDRLKEVMVNLVGNAIKYMGGAGVVTVSHEVRDGFLVTHIKDTGVGMSKEAQEKLFEKFYRIQTEKTREITGTGLGLFIVREIIEKMSGKIWAHSEGEGAGSTFSFSLPIAV